MKIPKGRIMADGSIVFPRRGKPPQAIQGYRRSSGNPFHFLPILRTCEQRTTTRDPVCGGMKVNYICTIKGAVNLVTCLQCQEKI